MSNRIQIYGPAVSTFVRIVAITCEEKGLVIAGTYKGLCEITEIKDHPWMVGVQFHPEFKSKPTAPHPLFKAFIGAILNG